MSDDYENKPISLGSAFGAPGKHDDKFIRGMKIE